MVEANDLAHGMISLHRCADPSALRDLKKRYLRSLVAPMDGMWEGGLIDPSPHWEIRLGGERAGYYAANDEGTLLQLFVRPTFEYRGRAIFDHVIAESSVAQATVGTNDPTFLSFCLDVQKKVTVHTYLYEAVAEAGPQPAAAHGPDLRLIEASELDRTVSLQQACMPGDKDRSGWLQGYSANLVERGELFVLCREEDWLGFGELRRSDSQAGVVDLGMMVAPDHRRKGWGTEILRRLRGHASAEGARAICSTTVENVGAQKAILRAGFISRHRIMDVAF